jgi:hypothetical protein
MPKEKVEEHEHHGCCYCGGKRYYWGTALIVAGLLFLAQDMGYLAGLSFWTILLLVMGIFLLLTPKKK